MGKFKSPIINHNSTFNTSKGASETQYRSFNMEFILQKIWYFSKWGQYPLISDALQSAPSSTQSGTVTYILQSVLHSAHWAIIMLPIDPKISNHTVAGTTRDKIWTSLETLEIVRNLEVLQARVSLWQHKRLDYWPHKVQRTQGKSFL